MYIVYGAIWWLQIYHIVRNLRPIVNSETVGVRTFRGTECTGQGNDWIDSNNKNGNRTSRRGSAWPWVCGDLLSLRSYGGLKSPELENFREIFAFFGQTTPFDKIFKILFGKFTSRHRSTLLWLCKIRENCPTGNRWKRALFTWPKKNIFSVPFQTVATARIALKVCHGQPPPTFGWQLFKLHLNWFTFNGVIAGVATPAAWKPFKERHKVFTSTRQSYSFSLNK